jgi:hypothetical protein
VARGSDDGGSPDEIGDLAGAYAHAAAFDKPASAPGVHATGAFPQLRLVGLVGHGTHVVAVAQLGANGTSERLLAGPVLDALTGDMLGLADRGFIRFDLWQRAARTGAALGDRVSRRRTQDAPARRA